MALNASALEDALGIVKKAVGKRPAVPILGAVEIAPEADGKVRVAATNFDVHVAVIIDGDCGAGGVYAPKPLEKALKTYEGDRVVVNGKSIAIYDGDDRVGVVDYRHDYWKVEEFPNLRRYDDSRPSFSVVNAQEWAYVMERALTTAGYEDNRPILAGVHTRQIGDFAIVESADGYRATMIAKRNWLVEDVVVSREPLEIIVQVAKQVKAKTLYWQAYGDYLLGRLEGGKYDVLFQANIVSGKFPDLSALCSRAMPPENLFYKVFTDLCGAPCTAVYADARRKSGRNFRWLVETGVKLLESAADCAGIRLRADSKTLFGRLDTRTATHTLEIQLYKPPMLVGGDGVPQNFEVMLDVRYLKDALDVLVGDTDDVTAGSIAVYTSEHSPVFFENGAQVAAARKGLVPEELAWAIVMPMTLR